MPITIDGYFGRLSTIALQLLLAKDGLATGPIDGYFGRKTVRALQTFLVRAGYDVRGIDGRCGQATVRGLQRWLVAQGAEPGPIDGRWGRRTTCALQTVLDTQTGSEANTFGQIVVARPVTDSVPTGTLVYGDENGLPVVQGRPTGVREATPVAAAVPVA